MDGWQFTPSPETICLEEASVFCPCLCKMEYSSCRFLQLLFQIAKLNTTSGGEKVMKTQFLFSKTGILPPPFFS